MSERRKIAELEAQGLRPVDIAARLSLTEGYISQVRSDVRYRDLLAQMQAATTVAKHAQMVRIDANYDTLEENFTNLLVENAQEICAAMVAKPSTLMGFMRTLNSAKRRSTGEANSAAQQGGTVIIDLPDFLLQQTSVRVEHNSVNEVISVDERPLVAMGSEQLAVRAGMKTDIKAAPLIADNSNPESRITKINMDTGAPSRLELLP